MVRNISQLVHRLLLQELLPVLIHVVHSFLPLLPLQLETILLQMSAFVTVAAGSGLLLLPVSASSASATAVTASATAVTASLSLVE